MARHPFELMHDPDEGPHILALLSRPDDAAARRRYADWLSARGDPRGELLALVRRLPEVADGDGRAPLIARIAELEAEQDESWLKLVVREGRVVNCGAAANRHPAVRFAFECSRSWEQLAPTADPSVRRCDGCASDVFLCESFEGAERHARRGDCISVPGRLVWAAQERFCAQVTGRPDPIEMWGRRLFDR